MKIEIEDLFYLYEKEDEKVAALRGLFLEIESGECLVIKGPNGSGKSTLVKVLSGFLKPSAGKIFIDGKNFSSIDPLLLRREYISSIDQKGNLLPDLSVVENISLSLTLATGSADKAKNEALHLLREYELDHLADLDTSQLSSGERQICALLAAVAGKPKILIADEPSGELDDKSADSVYQLLKSLTGKNDSHFGDARFSR
ncbi:MAG: ATP-binding cassette domain-containing protein [Actinomycetota bacterium]